MNLCETAATLIAALPPPPVPGGSPGDDVWWRVVGIVVVSLLAIALFLYIIRPLTPTTAAGIDEQREEEELARLAAQITTEAEDAHPGVIPFRTRTQAAGPGDQQTDVSMATTRLRRILGHSAHGEPVGRGDRRVPDDRRPGRPEEPEVDEETSNDSIEMTNKRATDSQEDMDDVLVTSTDVELRDLGGVAHRLPSEASRKPVDLPVNDAGAGLPGNHDLERPTDMGQPAAGGRDAPSDATSSPTISGEAPTQEDLDRLAAVSSASGKIVPFVRRPSKRDSDAVTDDGPAGDEGVSLLGESRDAGSPSRVMPITVDAQTREAIEAVIRQLLFYANVGEVLQGFGLYTDEHLRRFMADSGMPEEEFQALFAAVPPKRPEDWTRIEFISRIVRMSDGRVSADVQYVDGHQPNGTERLSFEQDASTKRWLIDDIQAI